MSYPQPAADGFFAAPEDALDDLNGRTRSRSPRRGAGWSVSLTGVDSEEIISTGLSSPTGDGAVATGFEIPSCKLGQLLGLNGMTIQKVKELTRVSRLHIQDKERAKYQPTIHIEAMGTPEQLGYCQQVLQNICNGDQSEIGHVTTYMYIEKGVIGKLMGHKGQTIKEMTQATGSYIEIQQDPAQVGEGGPRLFIAGGADIVANAVQLIERFIASPESRLEAVLQQLAPEMGQMASPMVVPPPPAAVRPAPHAASSHQDPMADLATILPQLLAQPENLTTVLSSLTAGLVKLAAGNGAAPQAPPLRPHVPTPPQAPPQLQLGNELGLSGLASSGSTDLLASPSGPGLNDVTGPLDELVVDVPIRFKGHLLGLHGQTIEKVRQVSGVVKCHMIEERGLGGGSLKVQIVGNRSNVEDCVHLINEIMGGDHTGIGHVTTFIAIDRSVVGKCMGHKGQTVKEMTEATGCYIEIQQDRRHFDPGQQEVPDGPRLFVAGPPENVEVAVQLIERFVAAPGSRLEPLLTGDQVPPGGCSVASAGSPPQLPPLPPQLPPLPAPPQRQPPRSPPPPQQLLRPSRQQQPPEQINPLDAIRTLATLPGLQGLTALLPLLEGRGAQGGRASTDALEVRVIEIPASKKGHLLGLHGQTIEKIRTTCGVKKCHLQETKDQGNYGSIHIEIIGVRACIEHCVHVIHQVISGDHSAIGHATRSLPVETHKVSRLMGHRGQVATLLKELTGCYLDIQQGPCPGVPAGEAQIFMAGPPENVSKAQTLVHEFLRMMDLIPPAESPGAAPSATLGLIDGVASLIGNLGSAPQPVAPDGVAAIQQLLAAFGPKQ